jgi:hypothetical protein
MSRFTSNKILFALLAAVSAVPTPVDAQSLDPLYPRSRRCTALNCEAITFRARVDGFNTNIDPHVASIGVGAQGCLRVQVTAATGDLQMTVVGPSGLTYFNDNNGSKTTPIVVIPLTLSGHYTVAISQTAIAATEIAASVSAGWYTPASNPNCFPRTLGR